MGQFSNWIFKDVEKFLKSNGFIYVGTKGSHYFYKNENGLLVVVPMHGSRSIPVGTMLAIVRQSGIEKSLWK